MVPVVPVVVPPCVPGLATVDVGVGEGMAGELGLLVENQANPITATATKAAPINTL